MGGCASTHDEHLYVVSTFFNPSGARSRTKLYVEFRDRLLQRHHNVRLYTIEAAFNDDFVVTRSNKSKRDVVIQVKAPQKLWLKENLINIVAQRHLPKGWQYMAWIDGDIEFEQMHWVDTAITQLKRHPVVQLWETAKFLGPDGEVLDTERSFGYFCQNNRPIDPADFVNSYPHPGFAWAMTREAYGMIGGLPDFNIVGSGDNHFAYALKGRVDEGNPSEFRKYLSPGFLSNLNRLETEVLLMQRNLNNAGPGGPGYCPGVSIKHHWHGDWKDRGYCSRYAALGLEDGTLYDPKDHLAYNEQGVAYLKDTRFLPAIQEYFLSRKEDSKEVKTDYKNKRGARTAPAGRPPRAPERGHTGHSVGARAHSNAHTNAHANAHANSGNELHETDYDDDHPDCGHDDDDSQSHHGHGDCHEQDVFSAAHAAY